MPQLARQLIMHVVLPHARLSSSLLALDLAKRVWAETMCVPLVIPMVSLSPFFLAVLKR